MAHLDVQAYVRRPRITVYSGVALTIRLLKAAPYDATPGELEALADMRDCALKLQEAVRQRSLQESVDLRPHDRRLDSAWASLHGHLVSSARMIGTPEAEQADALLDTLFPEGLSFVAMKVEAEWIHSRFLLARIDKEELEAQLLPLVTAPCLANLRSAHAALGQVLGLVESKEENENTEDEAEVIVPGTVGEQLTELAEAIAGYGRVLVGGLRRKKPRTMDRFLAAVAPLDAHRRANRRSSAGAPREAQEPEELIEIDGPLPPLPGLNTALVLDDELPELPEFDEVG